MKRSFNLKATKLKFPKPKLSGFKFPELRPSKLKLPAFRLFNFNIAARMIFGFSLVTILTAVIGGIGFSSLGTINGSMRSMYTKNLLPIRYLGEIRRELLTIRGDVFQYVAAEDSSEYDELDKSISSCFQLLKKALTQYKEIGLTEKEAQDIKKFEDYITYYEKDITAAIKDHRSGETGLAMIAIDNAGINRDRAIAILDNLVDVYTQAAERQELLGRSTYQNSSTLMLVMLLLCIVISISVTFIVTRSIKNPIKKTLALAHDLANGDLTSRIAYKGNDEVGELIHTLNDTAEALRNVLREVLKSSGSVTSASQQLSATMEETNASMQEIANGIGHIAENTESNTAAVQQISATISDIADKAVITAEASKAASQAGDEVKASAEQGGRLVTNVSDSINNVKAASGEISNIMLELENSAREINQAVELITGISEQTNLLSLNAAIEAARAGEQGRGFAVVAGEVRKLADQSKEATKSIDEMVKAIQNNCAEARKKTLYSEKLIGESSSAADETSSYIINIIEKINTIVTQINEIAATAVMQSAMTKEITASIDSMAENIESQASSSEQISATTQQQASAIEEVGATAEELAGMAETLNTLVSKFKV
ncbi:MAG TPA: methyl-accepting chemotaxis protein [Clostridia bacterium]|nr:methyl-accepting chemotaxis protein [Clostridia bacterium]